MSDIICKNYGKASVISYAYDIAIFSSSMNATKALRQSEQVCSIIQNKLKLLNIEVNLSKTIRI